MAITQRYIERRVDFNGCHHCELGLQTYAERVLGLLVAAIRPDTAQGEPPLLPRLNRYRPIGSSTAVRFKTVKPVQSTQASHLNCVAADTGSWEQAAATQLEIKGAQQAVNRWGKLGRWGFLACYELQLLLQTILQLPGVRQEAATLTA